mmetsp:Transcript_34346/g.110872  ORF Transcript_34346/g.110872 Transcript_34346/m.110872 type:complete len:640 (+) Transcript_34346:30-1949(+)|eukprot:scaffold7752_cov101-Isochrysis_galbana.AAC.8
MQGAEEAQGGAAAVAAAICRASPPYTVIFSTTAWSDTFGSRHDLRCLEGIEPETDLQLAGLLQQLLNGLAVRAPLCSRDRHGQVFRHMASAAPIFSAAGAVAFLRVAIKRICSAGELCHLPPLSLPDAVWRCGSSPEHLSSRDAAFEASEYYSCPLTPISLGASIDCSCDDDMRVTIPMSPAGALSPRDNLSPGALSQAPSERAAWRPASAATAAAAASTCPTGASDGGTTNAGGGCGRGAGDWGVTNSAGAAGGGGGDAPSEPQLAGAGSTWAAAVVSGSAEPRPAPCPPSLDIPVAGALAPCRPSPTARGAARSPINPPGRAPGATACGAGRSPVQPVAARSSAPPPSGSRQRPSGWLGTLEALASLGGNGLLGVTAGGRGGRGSSKPGRAIRADTPPSPDQRSGRPATQSSAAPAAVPLCATGPPPAAAPAAPATGGRRDWLDTSCSHLDAALARLPPFVPPPEPMEASFTVVTSASAPYVVQWASSSWLKLCGFRPSGLDVIGRPLSCIQGELTDRRLLSIMAQCVRERRGTSHPLRMINYDTHNLPFAHSVQLRHLPARNDRDGRCGPAFLATSTEVMVHPEAAERWRDMALSGGPAEFTDFWYDDFEDFVTGWSERIEGRQHRPPPPAKKHAK